ncbi:ABC transporter ATP-binding protein [Methanocorpusculum vombati]|uniref:ABC transporter ATP-binding protein n=1 Tax=Methanocorpusculum vombati TaxID=3002864 RepID=A0ABT4IJC1_9EURY|nr:ABC transporter ATP-binding protein [Methanocorpusculum vombati]MCZ9319541.1 ABC transporter ATP-binding protein [Methanocorpusculum sp.]MDE2521197.1 ABC transporter ATP-binding protein [Methanocorpusculum sp.]MDE2534934.1 ABC transporter ATP-binding protein [Methanocorpusculum sp.]MDE2545481.1 ABC transporter ATP-binding protein [Methanocorpusculum sp.]
MISVTSLRCGILDIPHLTIPQGITAVTGDNGAGKTTLLRALAGMVLPESGTIIIDGVPPRECEVGCVSEFPDRHLIFSVVHDEIASPLRFAYREPAAVAARVAEVAGRFGITHLLNRECRTLSGGEKMLVGVATALAADPVLLVLDEPDSHLDPETAGELFWKIRDSGCPHVVWSTHSRRIRENADQKLVLAHGLVEQT